MKLKSKIITLVIGLSLFSMACSKSANMSGDDKHKLFQAVGVTQNTNLFVEVTQKMGLMDSNGTTPAMEPFMKEHITWASKNMDFIKEHASKEKAEAYVKSHMP